LTVLLLREGRGDAAYALSKIPSCATEYSRFDEPADSSFLISLFRFIVAEFCLKFLLYENEKFGAD